MRILLVTGYASVATAVEAIKRGADDYLPKPATAPMILRTLGLVKPESVEIEATMTPLHRLGGNISTRRCTRLGQRLGRRPPAGHAPALLQRKLAKKPGPEREVLLD